MKILGVDMPILSSPIAIILITAFAGFVGVMAFSTGYQFGADLAQSKQTQPIEGKDK